jgi:RNA polymerase-interacting CarD/CdnL/TRCF family regulator
MTFDEAVERLEIAVREHGVVLEELLARLGTGEISREQLVSEIRLLQQAFERLVEELTREAKSSALAAMASLKAPESKAKN